MKSDIIKFVFSLVCLTLFLTMPVQAQEEARAAWQVTNFDINVANFGSERALNARAVLTVQGTSNGEQDWDAARQKAFLHENSKAPDGKRLVSWRGWTL